MFKHTLDFNDLDGNPITGTFYFNLSAREITDMNLRAGGGLGERLRRISELDTEDEAQRNRLMDEWYQLIQLSYGVRSSDNISFIKTEEAWKSFEGSDAFTVFYFQLLSNQEIAEAFANGIMPKDLGATADRAANARLSEEQLRAKTLEAKGGHLPSRQDIRVEEARNEPTAADPYEAEVRRRVEQQIAAERRGSNPSQDEAVPQPYNQ